jgi:hypothetical protein
MDETDRKLIMRLQYEIIFEKSKVIFFREILYLLFQNELGFTQNIIQLKGTYEQEKTKAGMMTMILIFCTGLVLSVVHSGKIFSIEFSEDKLP